MERYPCDPYGNFPHWRTNSFFQDKFTITLNYQILRAEEYFTMDSPTRDLLETLEHADRELEKMEKHQEEYERNLETFDASAENGTDLVTGASDQLKKLIEHHKGKALSQEQPTHILPGVGILHGTIIGAKGLVATDGTCDPFVKVSYVPPGDVSTSLMFRAKMTVHTTGVAEQTTAPRWDDGAFSFEVDAPPAQDGVPMHIESDWSRLKGDLLFTVYDCNRGTRNERIGQFVFPLRTLIDGKTPSTVQGGSQKIHDQWFPLDRRGKPSAAKLRIQMTLVLPNNVSNTDDYAFATDDLTNGDYEKKPKENYADTFRNILEENDSSSDEEVQDGDAVKENVESRQSKIRGTGKKTKVVARKKKKKIKIDRGAERREKERKRIAKENLILQKRMQKARTNGSGAHFRQSKASTKVFAADKQTARERLQKRIQEDDKILKQRIDKVRGKPKPRLNDEQIQAKIKEREIKAKLEATKIAQKNYDARVATMKQVEDARSQIQAIEEETTLIKSKAQRLETLTKKNNALIEEAQETKRNREKALKRQKKVRASSLPEGAKSAYSSFAGSKESEFTKLQREYDDRNKTAENNDNVGNLDREEELKDLRVTLKAALHTYEERQQTRRKFADEAKMYRKKYNNLERQIGDADSKLKEIVNRRKHRMRKATKKRIRRKNKARRDSKAVGVEGKEAAYDPVFDDEHDDEMYLDLEADAKDMSIEEQQRIEEIHAINKVEAKSRLEIKCVSTVNLPSWSSRIH